jgi:hypothetical protein
MLTSLFSVRRAEKFVMQEMAAKDYPIKTSKHEVARLRMQSDLFRADAKSMLDRGGAGGIRRVDSFLVAGRCRRVSCSEGGEHPWGPHADRRLLRHGSTRFGRLHLVDIPSPHQVEHQ